MSKRLLGKSLNMQDILVYLGIVLIAAHFLFTLKDIVFGTHDDLMFGYWAQTLTLKEYITMRADFLLFRGRNDPISLLLHTLVYTAYSSKNIFFIQAIQFVPFFICIIVACHFLYKNFGKHNGPLYALLFLLFLQVDGQHNLVVSYPLFYFSAQIIFFISLQLFLNYLSSQKKIYLVFSALLYFQTCLIYEVFSANLALFVIIPFLLYGNKTGLYSKLKYIFLSNYMHLIAGGLFAVLAIVLASNAEWKTYDGIQVDYGNFSVLNAIRAVLNYSFGYFPLRNFFRTQIFKTISLSDISFIMIYKASIGVCIAMYLLRKINSIHFRLSVNASIISLTALLAICIPFGISSRYQQWTLRGITAYVPSTLSYFWIVILIVIFLNFFVHIKKKIFRNCFLVFAGIVIFVTSIITDLTNQNTLQPLRNQNIRYFSFINLVNSNYFTDIPPDSIIYTNDYVGMHSNINTLETYCETITGNKITLTNDIDDLYKEYENKYILKFDNYQQIIMLGKYNKEDITCNEIFVLSLEEVNGSIIGQKDDLLSVITIDGVPKGYHNNWFVTQVNSLKELLITGDNMRIETITIVPYHIHYSSPLVYEVPYSAAEDLENISYLSGWHSQEDWGRWSSNECIIQFSSLERKNTWVTIGYKILPIPEGVDINVSCQGNTLTEQKRYVDSTEPLNIFIPYDMIDEEGKVELTISISGASSPLALGLNQDSRILGIGIESIMLEIADDNTDSIVA